MSIWEGYSLSAVRANISTKEEDVGWMVKVRHPQNCVHHPSGGRWQKIPLHHHDNSCYIIAMVTRWISLVFNHTHGEQVSSAPMRRSHYCSHHCHHGHHHSKHLALPVVPNTSLCFHLTSFCTSQPPSKLPTTSSSQNEVHLVAGVLQRFFLFFFLPSDLSG